MPLCLIYSSSREKWIHLCVWAFFCYWTLSENTSKHQDRIIQSAFFSKVRVVPKLTKKPTAQKILFFFFSRACPFPEPLSSVRGKPTLCVVGACIIKTNFKPTLNLESPSLTFRRGSNGNRQWEGLAVAACISQLLPPSILSSRNDCGTSLTPWSPPGKSCMISHSGWKGCVCHEVALERPFPCCSAPPNLQHSSPSLQKEKGPIFFFFIIFYV